jgi:hypothetical protein
VDRLSHLLRQAGERGTSDKHRLMRQVAVALADVEHELVAINRAIERGNIYIAKFRLKHIEKLLGCEQVVMDDHTDEYRSNTKCETSDNGN